MDLIIIKINHSLKSINLILKKVNLDNKFSIYAGQDISEIRLISNIIHINILHIITCINNFNYNNRYKYELHLTIDNVIVNKKLLFIIKTFNNNFYRINIKNININYIKNLDKIQFEQMDLYNSGNYYLIHKITNCNLGNLLYYYGSQNHFYYNNKIILLLLF